MVVVADVEKLWVVHDHIGLRHTPQQGGGGGRDQTTWSLSLSSSFVDLAPQVLLGNTCIRRLNGDQLSC
jgi:hypothetical protein